MFCCLGIFAQPGFKRIKMIITLLGFGLCLYGGISALQSGDKKKGAVNLIFALVWLIFLLFIRAGG